MLELNVNNQSYTCEGKLTFTNHVSNNAGSEVLLEGVSPVGQDPTVPFVIPPYAYGEVLQDGKRLFFGFVKREETPSLNYWHRKAKKVTLVSAKEFLIQTPMDFIVFQRGPQWVLEQVVSKLDNRYVALAATNTFANDEVIQTYNTRNMSAYDTLKWLEKQTDSFLIITPDVANQRVVVGFESINSLKANRLSPTTLDYLGTVDGSRTYEVEDVQVDRTDKNYNVVRVEADQTLSAITRRLEVNIATTPDLQVTTPYAVGYIVVAETRFVNNIGEEVRPLMIASSADVERGKPADIWYTQGATFINIHPRLADQEPFGRVIISYKIITKQNVDFAGRVNQEALQTNANLNLPMRNFRYEKQNDVGELSDIMRYGQKYLQNGIALKNEVTVVTHQVVWQVGDLVFCDPQTRDDNFRFVAGYYLVSEVKGTLVSNGDTLFATYTYTLSNVNDLETSINYFDSQSYRDNPVLQQNQVQIENSVSLDQNVYIVAVWGLRKEE